MSRSTLKCYTLIIEKIVHSHHPSKKQIIDHLIDSGFNVAVRTLDRYLENMRNEFGIEIGYNRSKDGYFIDMEKSMRFEAFIRFLETINTANIISDSLKDSKDALKYICFESTGDLNGIENLEALLSAIKKHIRFVILGCWGTECQRTMFAM